MLSTYLLYYSCNEDFSNYTERLSARADLKGNPIVLRISFFVESKIKYYVHSTNISYISCFVVCIDSFFVFEFCLESLRLLYQVE